MTTLRRSPAAGWRRLPDRVLVLPDDGDLLTLTGTAVVVWEGIGEQRRLDDLVDELAARFDAPRATVARDVDELVQRLAGAGAVDVGP